MVTLSRLPTAAGFMRTADVLALGWRVTWESNGAMGFPPRGVTIGGCAALLVLPAATATSTAARVRLSIA